MLIIVMKLAKEEDDVEAKQQMTDCVVLVCLKSDGPQLRVLWWGCQKQTKYPQSIKMLFLLLVDVD